MSKQKSPYRSQIDLHCHSNASDGALSPAEVVQRAKDQGVKMLALTDHDTTEGIEAAQQAASVLEGAPRIIAGVEISLTWDNTVIHMLGLNVDPEQPDLKQGLIRLAKQRHERAEKIAEKLEAAGVENAYAGTKALSKGQALSRTHFAHYLVQQGFAKDVRKVFKHYLVRGKPGYVAGEWAGLEEAVGWVKAAGGMASIAHPARYKMTRTKLKRLLTAFKAAGGQGLEVVSGAHSQEDNFQMAFLAQQFGLMASKGSDYHGPAHFWIELGRIPDLPVGSTPIWTDF